MKRFNILENRRRNLAAPGRMNDTEPPEDAPNLNQIIYALALRGELRERWITETPKRLEAERERLVNIIMRTHET